MPRRGQAPKRSIVPDSRYSDVNVARFINHLMVKGKKALAERIVYNAIDLCEERSRRNGLELFEQALRNATPMRRNSLAMRWLIRAARARSGRSMVEKLAGELQDTANGQSATTRRKDETFRMAEANKAFAHYRW